MVSATKQIYNRIQKHLSNYTKIIIRLRVSEVSNSSGDYSSIFISPLANNKQCKNERNIVTFPLSMAYLWNLKILNKK